ncbi:MAG TPA: hypothetical protein VGN95_09260 [Pyrinomonadaceae bacterium]|nr:hypothetical protein [Pyrinomonadaceae bacterium]
MGNVRRRSPSVGLNLDCLSKHGTVHGKKYIIDDMIEMPSGKSPVVRTVWIIDRGEDAPRLVTAYPHEE